MSPHGSSGGTIIEAAFFDPAYPNKDKVAELYLRDDTLPALIAAESESSEEAANETSKIESIKVPIRKTITQETTTKYRGFGFLKSSKSKEQTKIKSVVTDGPDPEDVKEALRLHKQQQKQLIAEKRAKARAEAERYQKTGQPQQDLWTEEQRLQAVTREEKTLEKIRAAQGADRYNNVPEGLLIYRLDTSTGELRLMSNPHANTDVSQLCREMTIAHAECSDDPTRRGITFVGVNGDVATLVACEQRTAIAWLEAIEMMEGRMERELGGNGDADGATAWAGEQVDIVQAENEYLSLAKYSNHLIRAGASVRSKAAKRAQGGAAGIYYTIEHGGDDGDADEETLESIAKRRAVIKDSWDFYRLICSLLRDRKKYDECFERMKLDPVYAYLNSMSGLSDSAGKKKQIKQSSDGITSDMLPSTKIKHLIAKANAALPSLVEICKALAGSLGLEEVGVGPIKEVGAAIRKAERKYEGDVLKITDYCRALLVVKDLPTLLALMELARDSFGPLIRRVKLSSLKADKPAMEGGYRDCKINIELNDHICEIQIHLWPMWLVCGVDGFRHYRHCVEYQTDTFPDAYHALENLDRKARGEIILMAEEAVAGMPMDHLDWYHEKYMLDYFAEVGLFMDHGMFAWAEVTLRRLIKLRIESPEIGTEHHETRQLQKYLERCLRAQDKLEEANELRQYLKKYEKPIETNEEIGDAEIQQSFLERIINCGGVTSSYANWGQNDEVEAAERAREDQLRAEEEKRLKREARASKKKWREIREERFKFLDTAVEQPTSANGDYP